MATPVVLKRLLKKLMDLLFRRRPSKRVFSPDSLLRRDLLMVFLIFMLGLSSQFFSGYALSQTVSSYSSTSQPTTTWHRNLISSTVSTLLARSDQVEKPNENALPVSPVHPSFNSPFPYVSPSSSPTPTLSPPSPSPSPSHSPSSMNLSLGIYKNNPNNNQKEILLDVDLSSITPGQERNSSVIYFKNEGDLPFTMSFSTANWLFLDSSNNNLSQNYSRYFTLRWNYDNSPLAVDEVRPVIFTLAVSSNTKDVVDFSFDVVLTITSSN
jgi:hypothetical protein